MIKTVGCSLEGEGAGEGLLHPQWTAETQEIKKKRFFELKITFFLGSRNYKLLSHINANQIVCNKYLHISVFFQRTVLYLSKPTYEKLITAHKH
jgi:hypothetical protein